MRDVVATEGVKDVGIDMAVRHPARTPSPFDPAVLLKLRSERARMTWQTIVTDFESHAAGIRSVRTEVFVREQSIPASDDFDQHDATCTHVLVLEKDNPVATGRLDLNQNGRIGRIAVLQSHRRRGLGTIVMNALENEARKANISRIWFHAQVKSIGFYESLGCVVSSESEFLEEGIPHVAMEKQLLM